MATSVKTSYEQSGTVVISPVSANITAVQIITNGSNDGKLIIYDEAASGDVSAGVNVVCEITVVGANHFGGRDWVHPVKCERGIVAVGTGTNATYIVEYF